MSKPKARAKTDAQLAEEEEARQEAEASQRRDPDKPFVSVGRGRVGGRSV